MEKITKTEPLPTFRNCSNCMYFETDGVKFVRNWCQKYGSDVPKDYQEKEGCEGWDNLMF